MDQFDSQLSRIESHVSFHTSEHSTQQNTQHNGVNTRRRRIDESTERP